MPDNHFVSMFLSSHPSPLLLLLLVLLLLSLQLRLLGAAVD